MKKTKRFLALALALCLSVGLAACSNSSTPGGSSSPAADGGSGDASGKTKITWWAFPTFGVDSGYEQELADAFMAANDDVEIEVVTINFTDGPAQLTTAITSGTAPDLLFDAPGRIIEYGNAGYLADMNDLFTDEFKADVNNEGLLSSCQGRDGTYYMYPISSSPFYMGLNLEMLESSGAIDYVNLEGDRTWTTDNFVKMCETLRDSGVATVPGIVYCGGSGGDQGTRALVNNLYSSTIVSDGKWNVDANGVKALELLQSMVSEGALDVGNSMVASDELQNFQKEICAMTFCFGTSNEVSYAPIDDAYTQVAVPFPSDDGVPELEYLVNGFCVFDNGDQAKIDASKRFIQFICDDPTWGPKSVVKTNAFPVRTSFGDLYEGDEHMALLASWTQYYGPYYNTLDNFATMRNEWFNLLQRVLAGGDAAAEAETFNTNANTVTTG